MILVSTGLEQSKNGIICGLSVATVRASEAIVEVRVC